MKIMIMIIIELYLNKGYDNDLWQSGLLEYIATRVVAVRVYAGNSSRGVVLISAAYLCSQDRSLVWQL